MERGGWRRGVQQPEVAELERLRPELGRYCYRLPASVFDADDAVQDTISRTWQRWDQLAEPGARRARVHRIATNVCLDKLRGRWRRRRAVRTFIDAVLYGRFGLPVEPPPA